MATSRDARVEVRLNFREKMEAKTAAAEAGITLSELVRRAVRDRVRYEEARARNGQKVPA